MRRHDLDPISLVFGAAFALTGVIFLFLRIDAASAHLDRVWPVAVLGIGLLIVALSARRTRRPDGEGAPEGLVRPRAEDAREDED